MRTRFLTGRLVVATLVTAGLLLPAVALARRRADPPIALLFVSRRCAACRTAATRLDALVIRRGIHAIVLADSGDWSRIAPHVRVAIDSGHVLARVFGIAAEPALASVTATVRYDLDR